MTVPGNIDALLLGGQRGYQIERSLRFNSADSAYLNRTPASAGNRKTWTWSGWVKRGNSSNAIFSTNSGDNLSYNYFGFSSDSFRLYQWNGSGYDFQLITSAVYRDQSAWYHFVISVDTTQGTAADRVKFYVNGTQVTAFSTTTNPSQNLDAYVNSTSYSHLLGRNPGGSSTYFDGYLTEIHFIDGQALTPSSFGETDTITGVWKPKKYAGTYGTNGFYLKFADNSGTTSTTLGKDSSGNGNNWTPNNFSVTAGAGNDSMIDTPTPYADGGNGRGNYATLNPLDSVNSTFANGNLDVTVGTGSGSLAFGNFQMKAGKWYWEVVPTSINNPMIGIADADKEISTRRWTAANGWYYYLSGQKYNNSAGTAYGASFTTNDVIGVAYDADNGSIVFYKNGTSQGTAFTGLTGKGIVPALNNGASATSEPFTVNFGQRAFAYTPPSGFLALNTQNLPEPSIKKPNQYFDAKLYTGNGSTQTISGFDFSPDLVWIKSRSAATNNDVFDSVRGATVGFATNSTQAESTFSGVTAFNSNGFSLGSNTSDNANSATYVAWCWDESATPGFDIVTFTGNGSAPATISHSLGVAAKMMIVKNRDQTGDWVVYHSSITNSQTGGIFLNLTNAWGANSTYFNNSVPTSSNFQVGSYFTGNNIKYVAYLWSEVAGFSKFGSYTGNGSSDGPFVFCGFRPRWVLAKRSDASAYNWFIFDAARSPENVSDEWLLPNGSNAEQAQVVADMVSNGFKIRSSLSEFNINGGTYIFAAFAESPFKYSLAR